MRTSWLALALLSCTWTSSPSFAQESEEVGFGDSELGSLPEFWHVPTPGWKAELTEDNAALGKRVVRLSMPGESTAPFGNVMRSMPADKTAGRHVRLSAKIFVVGDGRAQMWLRVDRPNRVMGAFDNMHDRPILPGEWQNATIEADVDPDAKFLNIGFMSFEGATVFVDEVTLKISGSKTSMQAQTPALALTQRATENVVAATKLLGYVRFFHPSDQAVGIKSWDHFAVDLMDRVEPATDAAELAKCLSEAFTPIAPTVEVWVGTPNQAPSGHPAPKSGLKVASWRHVGVGSLAARHFQQIYTSSVEKISLDPDAEGPEEPFVIKDLGAGVSCRVPLTVRADKKGTLPHGKTPDAWASKRSETKLTALNRSTRLAGVALGWGIFQHFYPYFDVVKTDWDAALPLALAQAALDSDERAYLNTLRELVAKLHDGHGRVGHKDLQAPSMLPLVFQWVGTDLVIVGKHADVPDAIEIGDRIVSIDGKAIEDCHKEVCKRISAATEGWSRTMSQQALLVDLSTKDPAQFVVRKLDDREIEVDLPRVRDWMPKPALAKRPENGTELEQGIVYFNLNRADVDELEKMLPKLTEAKGVIFDLRGYPGSAGKEVIEHLIDEPATSARWCVPVFLRPDQEGVEWIESGRWQLVPKEPRLAAKIAFLTDGRAISYAESVMGIVEHYKLGEIIGSTTAGTNGNVNPFTLPGGYEVSWTGMKVLKHDGSQHHGRGIGPTVPAMPTARGIAEGRDEVLETAVAVLESSISSGALEEE